MSTFQLHMDNLFFCNLRMCTMLCIRIEEIYMVLSPLYHLETMIHTYASLMDSILTVTEEQDA